MQKIIEKKFEIWLIFAFIVTFVVNKSMGTTQAVLWISAYASLCNLFLTNKRSKWFIVPDLIWVFCMLYVAFEGKLMYDGVQYTYYLIMAPIQYRQWTSHADGGVMEPRRFVPSDWIKLIVGLVVLVPILGMVEVNLLGNTLFISMIDAFNTSLSLLGAYFIANRYAESQILFLVGNISTAILYFERGIPSVAVTMLLFATCTMIAIPTWFKSTK